MSSREFAEWIAFSRYHPFGYDRLDLSFAIVAQAIYNSRRTKASDPKAEIYEFIPKFREPSPEVDRNRVRNQVDTFMAQWGAKPEGEARGSAILRKNK